MNELVYLEFKHGKKEYFLKFKCHKFSKNIITIIIQNSNYEILVYDFVIFYKQHILYNDYVVGKIMSKNDITTKIQELIDSTAGCSIKKFKIKKIIEIYTLLYYNKWFLKNNNSFNQSAMKKIEYFVIEEDYLISRIFVQIYFLHNNLLECRIINNKCIFKQTKQYEEESLDFFFDNLSL
jgi:hypothetical protein